MNPSFVYAVSLTALAVSIIALITFILTVGSYREKIDQLIKEVESIRKWRHDIVTPAIFPLIYKQERQDDDR